MPDAALRFPQFLIADCVREKARGTLMIVDDVVPVLNDFRYRCTRLDESGRPQYADFRGDQLESVETGAIRAPVYRERTLMTESSDESSHLLKSCPACGRKFLLEDGRWIPCDLGPSEEDREVPLDAHEVKTLCITCVNPASFEGATRKLK